MEKILEVNIIRIRQGAKIIFKVTLTVMLTVLCSCTIKNKEAKVKSIKDYVSLQNFESCTEDRDYYVILEDIIDDSLSDDGYDTTEEYYEAIKSLPVSFQTVLFTTIAVQEILNGGFANFLRSNSEKFYEEAIKGFDKVGAVKLSKSLSDVCDYYELHFTKNNTPITNTILDNNLPNAHKVFFEESENFEVVLGKYLKRELEKEFKVSLKNTPEN